MRLIKHCDRDLNIIKKKSSILRKTCTSTFLMTGKLFNFLNYNLAGIKYQCDGIILRHFQLRYFQNHDGKGYHNYNEIDFKKEKL